VIKSRRKEWAGMYRHKGERIYGISATRLEIKRLSGRPRLRWNYNTNIVLRD
jgi:hypothetical protein